MKTPSTILNVKKLNLRLIFLALLISNSALAQWTRKADEISKRAEANNVLYNNKLYVFGGFGDNPVIEKTNEVYDIATNTWSQIASFPAGKEVTHQGIILVDDNIWIIGGRSVDGYGPVSSKVIIYNITTNTWKDGPELIDPSTGKAFPIGGGGYALLGHTIHVFGGFGPTICEDQANLHLTIDVDKYVADPVHVTWENKLAPMPIPRNHISYVVLAGKIYALGGQFKHDCVAVDQEYCHVYDITTNKWTQLTNLPKPRSHAEAATFAVDGKIFLAAGQGYNNITQNTTYQFNPKDNNNLGSWTDLPAYKLPGSFLGLSAKLAGKNYIITNGALDNYGNERKETYTAVVTRSTARTLGFTNSCLAQSSDSGKVTVLHNLLYCIEDTSPFVVTSDANWLTVTKNNAGTVNLNGTDIEVSINTAGLAAGSYTGKITANGALASSRASFCVTLNVNSSSGYTLNLTTKGSGSVVKTPDHQYYAADSTVLLNAVPATGWKFNGWSGDTSLITNPLKLVFTGNKIINATFIQDDVAGDLITNVKATTGKSYQLTSLIAGTIYYSDRTYSVTSVPASLENAAFIKTACDDKANKSTSVLSFNLAKDATVYVGYDPRATTLPAWLKSWQKLTDKVQINDPKVSAFNIYSKSFKKGQVTIGGNSASPEAGALCEYIVIAKAADDTVNDNAKFATITNSNFKSLATEEVIKEDTVKANENIKAEIKPILYPNPVSSNFSVVFPESYKGVSRMQIVDRNGKTTKVPPSQIKSSGATVAVNIAPLLLKKGLYSVLMVSNDGKTDVIRIILN